jgi:hypothetical protein
MSLEHNSHSRSQDRPPRQAAFLALATSTGAGMLTLFTTHDLRLSVEIATFVLAAAESIRRD